ncbi:MAG: Wzz/FepE/Etk N-terminal domain-containing protein, partial [Bacteroidota bacterium]
MSLITIFTILYRRKWILIGVPITAAVAAFFLTADYQRTYRSSAQISTGFTISPEVQLTSERFNLFEVDVKFNNLIETVNSPRVLSLLSYNLLKHDLDNIETPFRRPGEGDQDVALELSKIETSEVTSNLKNKLDSMKLLNNYVVADKSTLDLLEIYDYDVESLKEVISISRVKNTDYVSIVAYTESPFLSSYMVNTLCSEFLRFNAFTTNARSDESVNIFSKLVSQKKEELDRITEELRVYKSTNSLLNFSAESESKISQISSLESQVQEEQKNARSIRLQLQDVENRIKASDNSNVNNTIFTEIVSLKKSISLLNQKYLAGGSKDDALLDSLIVLRNRQQSLIASASQMEDADALDKLVETKNQLDVELKISEQNLTALQSQLSQLRRNVGGYASKEARIAELERELNLASEEYRNAQEKYNQSLNVSVAASNSMTQVLFGQPASDPESSKRLIITALSGISTFVICVLIIILLEYVDVSIKSTSNFIKTVGLPLTGSLVALNFKKMGLNDLFTIDRSKLDKKANLFRESLRKIRFLVEQRNKKSFLITSTKSGEGKTTLINSLALALSYSKSKVILVDANFTNNELTRRFKAKPSLENLLANEKGNLEDAISKTDVANVDIIGCEGGNYSPLLV